MKVQYPFVQGPRIVGGELPLAENGILSGTRSLAGGKT